MYVITCNKLKKTVITNHVSKYCKEKWWFR